MVDAASHLCDDEKACASMRVGCTQAARRLHADCTLEAHWLHAGFRVGSEPLVHTIVRHCPHTTEPNTGCMRGCGEGSLVGAGVCWGGGGRARSVRLSAALDGGLARPDALVRCMAAVQGLERHPSQNGEKVWSSSGAVGSNSGHHPAKDLNLLSRFHALGSPPRALREAFPSLCFF